MAEAKRYYWLKFKEDFFDSKRIKKLRKMAGGDTYVIIYLKMQLKALKTDGMLEFTGVEQDFADELALDIDESPDDVRVVLTFLLTYGMCECSDNIHYYLPYVIENTGSETAATQRWRDWKKRQDEVKVLETNTTPTLPQRTANVEKEIEKEIESRDRDREKNNTLTLKGSSVCATASPRRFTPPSLEEVRDYCRERGNTVDPGKFIDFYESKGWMVGKNKMKDWKAAVRTWERSEPKQGRMSSRQQDSWNKWHPECERSGYSGAKIEDIELHMEDFD